MRIPFDSIALRAIVEEAQAFVGAQVQRITQPEPLAVVLGLYAPKPVGEGALLLEASPDFSRSHFITRRPKNSPEPFAFCATLRARLVDRVVQSVVQVGADRLLEIAFDNEHTLVAELMGKHSNVMLVDECGRVVAALKWVSPQKSSRPIQSGQPYVRPPVFDAGLVRLSPFAQKLMAAGESLSGSGQPVLSPGNGAYPYSVAALGLDEVIRPTLSIALEQHFEEASRTNAAASLKRELTRDIDRVLIARDAALHDLRLAIQAADEANHWQRQAELVLAYAGQIKPGDRTLEAFDFAGDPISIPLDPEADFKGNAERLFSKARRAKDRLGFVVEQEARLTQDRSNLLAVRLQIGEATALPELERLSEEVSAKRWRHQQPAPNLSKDERPYAGHRIREALGPMGYRILFGENAEANDYLTLRVAKPSDWWLHIRGGTSAHVIIVTGNKPERVGPEVLNFAAKVAVKHSPSKHAGYVAVDYTLKKYVRKPRGAAKGTALYTHEKTLHVDGE